jgi:hypothetical protein
MEDYEAAGFTEAEVLEYRSAQVSGCCRLRQI